MNEYPKVAEDCEEYFIVDGWELTCGKKTIFNEWVLCDKCKKLKENQMFLK